LVRRIPIPLPAPGGKAEAIKGICASASTARLYVTTPKRMMCFDLVTDALLWSNAYDAGCDRMSITADGTTIYLPSFEGDDWYVVNGVTGAVNTRISPKSGAHNTIVSPTRPRAYLAGLRSPLLSVVDTKTQKIVSTVGPFSASIRPFTVNGADTLCFVNVNELLGFEVGDMRTGKMLHRVEVPGFKQGPVKRHGCPSHGIAMSRDEREVWVCDSANNHLHIFDATVMPPTLVQSIDVRDQPGWITFTIDGRLAIPSSGEIIDVASRKIMGTLSDETGVAVQSEKLLDVVVSGRRPVSAGNQFAIGGKS
jgi:DNA-binding beta-propeller fold protein YncE